MSVVRWDGIEPREARGAESINGFFDAFEAISPVSAANLAEEGLDRLALDAKVVAVRVFEKTETTADTITTATGSTSGDWTAWDPTAAGGNPFRATAAALELADDEVLVAWFHVELQSDATDLGISECTRFETRIFGWNGSVSVSGGQGVLATGEFSGANSGGYHQAHGRVSTFAVFIGPYATTYVEPQYRLNRNGVAGSVKITPSKSTFYGFKFKRAR